ncbi:hypothetical protein F5B20DRAFT_148165 [Whalleya microplaca]|nr:hypothetical protein F5B20DRAFT_148165 [Whalleya microplaca]
MDTSFDDSPTPTGIHQKMLCGTERPSPSTPTPTFHPRARHTKDQEIREAKLANRHITFGTDWGPTKLPSTTTGIGPEGSRRATAMPPTYRKPAIPSPVRTANDHHRHSVSSSRKLSASFGTEGPLSSQPTTAYSSVTASTATGGPLSSHPGPLTSHPVRLYSSMASSSSSGNLDKPSGGNLRASHTFSNLPSRSIHRKDVRQASPSNLPLPKTSTATTYTTATALPRRHMENIPPSSSAASLSNKHKDSLDISSAQLLPKQTMKAKPKLRGGIPRSRTLNMFSNLTSSLSRTSLGSFTRNDSRQASNSSTSTNDTTATPLNTGNGVSDSSQSSPNPNARTPTPSNPRQIHTAQSSEYWTGRFLALQDRFHSELLLPENMTTLLNAHAERAGNRPVAENRPTALLPNSFTTSCISSTTAPATPRKPTKQPLSRRPQDLKHKHKQTPSSSTLASLSKQCYSTAAESAGLLNDEDNRAHRVFLHLEAMCTTSEARRSLHAWQQSYARRTGKEVLLPKGGTMEDRDKGWVGRLFSGSGQGKRGSFVL